MDVPLAVGRGSARRDWWAGDCELRVTESVTLDESVRVCVTVAQPVKLCVKFHISVGQPIIVRVTICLRRMGCFSLSSRYFGTDCFSVSKDRYATYRPSA